MRRRGERIIEPRVLVDAGPLIEEAKKKLGISYEALAKKLGISKTTLLDYKSGRALIPLSVYNSLKHIVKEHPSPSRIFPPYWGQSKGGLISGRKARLSRSKAKVMALKSHLVRKARREHLISELAKELQNNKPVLLAEFVGRMLGDGSISRFPKYLSSEYENHVRMRELVKSLFNYEPRTVKRERYYETRLRRISVQVLRKLGIPLGKKSITNPHIPSFILRSNRKEVIKALIRGYFDDEAYISRTRIEVSAAVRIRDAEIYKLLKERFKGRKSVSVKLASKALKTFKPPKSNILEGIKLLLSKLGIHAKLKCVRILFNQASASVEWKLIISGDDFHKALETSLLSGWKRRTKP
ncbi:MAG: helix-turn-helix domain-containing protein [Thaumarchaeota archaeon]|nr:helix-turn-helix domain-containing protein [Nitrososphaerota archaeon]